MHLLRIKSIIFPFLATLLIPAVAYSTSSPEDTSLYQEICEIRVMFCGATTMVLVSTVVISVGIAIFVGKIKWPTVFVLLIGITLFVSAEQVLEAIFTPPPGSDVMTHCSCL